MHTVFTVTSQGPAYVYIRNNHQLFIFKEFSHYAEANQRIKIAFKSFPMSLYETLSLPDCGIHGRLVGGRILENKCWYTSTKSNAALICINTFLLHAKHKNNLIDKIQ